MTVSANLIPAARLERRRLVRRVRRWAIVCGAWSIAIGAGCTWSVALRVGMGDKEQRELAAAGAKIDELSESSLAKHGELADAAAIVRANMVIRLEPDWCVLMGILAETLGDDAVLESLRIQPGDATGAPDEGTDSAAYVVFITGASRSQMDISAFILRLERLELFDRVMPIDADMATREDELVGFALRCTLNPMEATP